MKFSARLFLFASVILLPGVLAQARIGIYSKDFAYRYEQKNGEIIRTGCRSQIAPYTPCDLVSQTVSVIKARETLADPRLYPTLVDFDRKLRHLESVRTLLDAERAKWDDEVKKSPSPRSKQRLEMLQKKVAAADLNQQQIVQAKRDLRTKNASFFSFMEKLEKGFTYLGEEMQSKEEHLTFWLGHLNRLFATAEAWKADERIRDVVFRCRNVANDSTEIQIWGRASFDNWARGSGDTSASGFVEALESDTVGDFSKAQMSFSSSNLITNFEIYGGILPSFPGSLKFYIPLIPTEEPPRIIGGFTPPAPPQPKHPQVVFAKEGGAVHYVDCGIAHNRVAE